jgi:transcription-repair coupling factor (superfamily II helicase)
VHIEHGIARFVGTITMEEDPGVTREYLHLVYSGGAKLYVPSDQLDRISRYIGPGDHAPQLSSLGTQEWERAKARVKQNAMAQARELLDTAAARQVKQGIQYPTDTPWQQELEGSFPYVETADQLQAVHDVKGDMEKLQPMDRLICGDVGYGKTEVAVRAAFKAVQGGRQVAVLVPTTVLAQQHYTTFSQRLSAFPVKVEVLSRFRSEPEAQQVLAGLADGSVDIVIGTHRLLQKGVQFANLGLAIIDEEQRFGVMHKEYFKRLRHEIDVLTLTATPIPRTLYMAMAGVRDMSVIDTPPEERLPVKTYVNDFDEQTVRHAILRELERGGQVFFVHNRVQNIAHIMRQLADLVPEATFGVGHGQMPEDHLEQVMVAFSEGRCDVLVCTTIIESGLDLPNVNTIIINDADKLGLAQLYQLRGRVGRGSSRAYAYLLYPRSKAITERAQRRLQAVFEATEAGAGYFIAMKDLEIRGAGNLLGTEQSGHVGAVGFDLYCRILASAVEDVKAGREGLPMPSAMPQAPAVSLDLRLPAYLPEDYVPGLDERLDIYRRLAAATEVDALEEMEQELYDRFGPLPHAVEHLVYAVRVKLLATRAGAATVQREGDEMVVRLLEGLQVPSGKLAGLAGVTPGRTLLRVDARGAPNRWQPRLESALQRLAG